MSYFRLFTDIDTVNKANSSTQEELWAYEILCGVAQATMSQLDPIMQQFRTSASWQWGIVPQKKIPVDVKEGV